MAQNIIHKYMHPRTADSWNTKWENSFPACLTKDMSVQKGTSNFDITIDLGFWLCGGVLIQETAALTDHLTSDSPSASDRIDVVYGTYAFEADPDYTAATYGLLKGTPGASPIEPSVGANQVKIASIYIPSTASTLDDCYIRAAGTMQAKLETILGLTIQGNFWVVVEGDPFVTTGSPTASLVYEQGIKDGDLWLDLTGLDLYVYDADNNLWVTSDVTAHRTTHYDGGSDELDVAALADAGEYLHKGTAAVHNDLGLSHDNLADVSEDDHHNKDHSSRHHNGADDALDVAELADVQEYLHIHPEEPLVEDDMDEYASAVGAPHSQQAKDAAAMDGFTKEQIMIIAVEVFG